VMEDERIPLCPWCGENQPTKKVGGVFVCLDCYEDWLMGRFDEEPPAGYHDEVDYQP
jgi:hypothetical protein